MAREVSTPWLGIQQMNECSHRALTIIASGYGSELSEALLQSPMIVEEEQSETRASNGVELPYGKFSFLFFFFYLATSYLLSHFSNPLHIFATDTNHITSNTFLNIWFRVAFGLGFVFFLPPVFTYSCWLLCNITPQQKAWLSEKSEKLTMIMEDYGSICGAYMLLIMNL